MKRIYSIILVVFTTFNLIAQSSFEGACGLNSTNPCIEFTPLSIDDNACFDWTRGSYRVSLKKTGGTACLDEEVSHKVIRSPFYPKECGNISDDAISGQVNTSQLWLVPANQVTGNSELKHMDKDMFPSQGWVLLFSKLGKWKYVLNSEGKLVKDDISSEAYPSFVLYNKYTGIIRFLLYDHCKPTNFSGVELSLILSHNFSNTATRIFDDIAPFSNALNSEQKSETKAINVTNVVVDEGIWYLADFITSYDPCLEGKTSGLFLNFNMRRIQAFNVDLKVNGSIVSTQNSNSLVKSPLSASLLSNFDYNGIGKATVSAYKEFNGYKSMIQKYTEKFSDKTKLNLNASTDKIISNQLKLNPTGISSDEKLEIGTKNNAGNKLTTSNTQTFLLGITNTLPYLGTVYGLFKHFTSGTQSLKSSPTVSTVNLNISGTVTLEDEMNFADSKSITLPGTNRITGSGAGAYKHTLGLFKLLNKPKLSYYQYNRVNIDGSFVNFIEKYDPRWIVRIEDGNTIYADALTTLGEPLDHYNGYSLRQFYLNEPLKIMVNESVDEISDANIEVLSAEAAFVLEYDKKYLNDLDKRDFLLPKGYFPILPNDTRRNKKFSDICNEYGWYVESATQNIEERNSFSEFENIRIRTKYLPLNVFQKQSFYLSWPTKVETDFFTGNVPEAEVKLVITYRPKDPEYSGPNLLFIRSFKINLENAERNQEFTGEFGFKLTDQIVDRFVSTSAWFYPSENLFKNTEIEKITFNPFHPNNTGTYNKEPNFNLELLNSNPYQVYTDERTLDIFDPELSLNENGPYNNLSNRLLFFNSSSTIISPFWKNWSNVIVASTGEFLAIRHPRVSIPDGDFSIPSNFNQCSFSNSKTIIIDNAFNQTPINFSKCEFVASEKVLLSGRIKLEAGSVVGTSTNPIFKSTPQYYLNDNIANRDEIADVCESQEYKDAVRVLSVKPTGPFFDSDSSNFKNRIQLINYKVFPNPANNTVTVQAPKSETVISEIVLKNLLGMEVQRFVIKNPSSDVTIDVSTIPVGLYILNVNNFSTRLGIQR